MDNNDENSTEDTATAVNHSNISNTDGRRKLQYHSRYPEDIKIKIKIEAMVLAAVVVGALVVSLLVVGLSNNTNIFWLNDVLERLVGSSIPKFLTYVFVGCFGTIGGATFSIKWLIHSVAKGYWNEDRVYWRYFVPLTSCIISVVFTALVFSELIRPFDHKEFGNWSVCIWFGFLTGYFSDSLIGVLNNLSNALFGTVKDSKPGER
ncbi:MAG: hypothetical protein JKY55_20435 [Aliivibrio sp.]|uniref:hypothetical protein n=1 Tax=Aliivibrio sp. TaxID=1872443 RepID=UPI001A4D01F8|nr:hypothetical protein [Aliivibrio sp.]